MMLYLSLQFIQDTPRSHLVLWWERHKIIETVCKQTLLQATLTLLNANNSKIKLMKGDKLMDTSELSKKALADRQGHQHSLCIGNRRSLPTSLLSRQEPAIVSIPSKRRWTLCRKIATRDFNPSFLLWTADLGSPSTSRILLMKRLKKATTSPQL